MEHHKIYLLTIIIAFVAAGDYWQDRETLLKRELSQSIGFDLKLSQKEVIVNDILMHLKYKVLDDAVEYPGNFPPAYHFFESRLSIEQSEMFKFIRMLPKGCVLHSHDFGMTSFDYLYNLTYRENLYACENRGLFKLKFMHQPLNSKGSKWVSVKQMRSSNSSFDDWLQSRMTLVVQNHEKRYPNYNVIWKAFIDIFMLIEPMVTYKEVFQEYFYHGLEEHYDDNVMYLEFRTTLPEVYDLSGRIYEPVEVAGLYKKVLDKFVRQHRGFQGARLIYAPTRAPMGNRTFQNYLTTLRQITQTYPDFVAGFDLVGPEDWGPPLEAYANSLRNISNETKFFFHAGETNWNGLTDLNLLDAVLLGSRRIGHGFALMKHPEILRIIKEQGIAVEISPISNQVLSLVTDLRNHPGANLIAQGYPVVICNDDPSFWGASGLSYDWYMAFMAMTSRDVDLRFLKQLALNSYLYNAMSKPEKKQAIKDWYGRWKMFINYVLVQFGQGAYLM